MPADGEQSSVPPLSALVALLNGPSGASAASRSELSPPGSHAANIADGADVPAISSATADSALHAAMVPLPPGDQYASLAQAVATLLSPTITAAVDRAIAAGITQLIKELGDQAKRPSELELCISDLEDEVQTSFTSDQQSEKAQQFILDKLDALENRSRCNNLQTIDLPEYINAESLHDICTSHIPATLEISSHCTVERVYQLGASPNDRRT